MEQTRRPVRVLMVQTRPYAQNGITTVVKNYCFSFDPTQVTVDLATPNPLPAADEEALLARGGKSFVLFHRNSRQLAYIRALSRIVRDGKYDIVHAHGNSATLYTEMLAAKLGGAKLRIAHSHNTSYTHPLLHALLNGPFQRLCTHAFACGQDAGNWLFPGRPFTVMNNAVDTSAFAFDADARSASRAALGIRGDAMVLGHVGSFTPRKNHGFLLEVFALVRAKEPNAQLLCVGGGPELAAIREKAKALGVLDGVCFYGETADTAPMYQAMDAFLLPSFSEGLPFTLIEAQAAGLPCFASAQVTREADMTGLVRFLPLDANAWADAVLAAPPEDRAVMREKRLADIAAAGYGLHENAEKIAALYRAMTEEAPCRS